MFFQLIQRHHELVVGYVKGVNSLLLGLDNFLFVGDSFLHIFLFRSKFIFYIDQSETYKKLRQCYLKNTGNCIPAFFHVFYDINICWFINTKFTLIVLVCTFSFFYHFNFSFLTFVLQNEKNCWTLRSFAFQNIISGSAYRT